MNLWIRSQKNNDNTRPILLKVESLELGDDYDDMNCIVANNLYNIGTYKNKERTLEVLDEIQSKINDIHKDYLMSCMKEKGTYEIIAWEDFVYEMPKK